MFCWVHWWAQRDGAERSNKMGMKVDISNKALYLLGCGRLGSFNYNFQFAWIHQNAGRLEDINLNRNTSVFVELLPRQLGLQVDSRSTFWPCLKANACRVGPGLYDWLVAKPRDNAGLKGIPHCPQKINLSQLAGCPMPCFNVFFHCHWLWPEEHLCQTGGQWHSHKRDDNYNTIYVKVPFSDSCTLCIWASQCKH